MSDLLNSASLVMIPSGYAEDKVYSVVPSDGSGDLSFTRASNGTRVNSAGLVEVAPWNLLEQSEDFSTWTTYNTGTGVAPVITVNDATAPNGTTTADKIVFNTGAGTSSGDISTIYQTVANQPIGVFTASIYAKVASGTAKLVLRHAGGGQYTTLNLTSDWQRFEIAETNPTVGGVTFELGLRRGLANEPISSPVTCYLWGAQLNIGSTAKPYFPTTDRLNVPRLTYQNGGGGCPSLLLEKQSTNLMYPSEDFTNINWAPSNLTITANDATSPDGTQNADKFTSTSTTIENQVRFGSFAILSNVGSSYTVSVFAKKGTADFLRIRNLFTQDGATSGNAWFNLSTGAVGTVQSSQTASMQNMGNGWYRCVLTGVVGATNTYDFVDIGFTNTDGANFPTTSVNGYVYGAQLEASSYATSYIVSTSSSATRVADVAQKTGISSLIGQTEGTIFYQIQRNNTDNDSRLQISDGTTNNWLFVSIESGLVPRLYCNVGGVNQFSVYGSSVDNGFHKVALAYKNNDFKVYIDGVASITQTSGSVPTCSVLSIANTSPTNDVQSPSQISQAILFPTRLTNAELASLTTI